MQLKHVAPIAFLTALIRDAGGLALHSQDAKPSSLPAALRLASDSPCAPSADRVVELLRVKSGRDAKTPALKFYMYDDGAFNLTATMDCFFAQTNGTLGHDEMDYHVPPQTAQHMTDYWLLELMRNHPSRTSNPEEADLFVVGAPLMSSWFAAHLHGRCEHLKQHFERADRVYDALQKSPYWARSGGRDHFFINTSPWGHLELSTHGPGGLYDMMFGKGAGNVIYATADRNYRGLELYKNAMVVPYKAHYLLDKPGQPRTNEREVAITFHGDMGRGTGFRSRIPGLAGGIPGASIRDTRVTHGYIPMDELRGYIENTAMTYLNSSFCFVPAGDTPTSRRLFDSLAAGCIPVVLADFDCFADSLPFKKTVNWEEIAIFAGDFDCAVAKHDSMAAWLKDLVAQRGGESAVEVHKRGLEAFRHLSYHSPDLVDAVLREAQPYL